MTLRINISILTGIVSEDWQIIENGNFIFDVSVNEEITAISVFLPSASIRVLTGFPRGEIS